jgi:hypothetical protein
MAFDGHQIVHADGQSPVHIHKMSTIRDPLMMSIALPFQARFYR